MKRAKRSAPQPAPKHLGEGLPDWLYVEGGRVALRSGPALADPEFDLHDLTPEAIGGLVLFATHLANGVSWDDAFALVAARGAVHAVGLRGTLRRASVIRGAA